MVHQDPQERAKQVLERLEVLWHKLEDGGHYVGANTVHMAQRLIMELAGIEHQRSGLDAATAGVVTMPAATKGRLQ